jgi:hypothetical protein
MRIITRILILSEGIGSERGHESDRGRKRGNFELGERKNRAETEKLYDLHLVLYTKTSLTYGS